MNIEYYAASGTMGDTSESDCNAYRKWAKATIKSEYPDAEVEVLDEENLNISGWTDIEEKKEEVNDFCSRLWDACPWDWAE